MSITRLRDFVAAMTRLVEHQGNAEAAVLEPARDLLSGLVAYDDWLPEPFAACDPTRYRQYLLYGDPLDRFTLDAGPVGRGDGWVARVNEPLSAAVDTALILDPASGNPM